ncbi:Eukaryotic translation initiation factor 4G [Abeliophyllum distichum]|uniref:Eukaryotic translation initiation factor 4G n=1 Tax=Abeliophyllum distichum TaxID=126358 RepID=A0ABD1TFN0_9LAMI
MKNEQRVNDRNSDGLMTKKYSRDVLLKFTEQRTDLPEGFEIPSDMVDIFPRFLRSPPPPPPSSVKERVLLEPNAAKRTMPRGKKKKKELYRKAKAAGTSSGLCMAYKGPEEKKETDAPAQNTENTLSNTTDVVQDIAISSLKFGQSKVVPENWEDVVDISTP